MSKGGSPRSVSAGPRAPSDFALAHEYYTPTVVAEALADLVCDGIVQAIEPSMGIGRFVRALGPPHVSNNPAILGGAALATIGIAIGVSRRSRAGAHL